MVHITYARLNLEPETTTPLPNNSPAPPLLDSFFRVRPVVETGWEVMLINRALQEGRYDAGAILRDYTVRELRCAHLCDRSVYMHLLKHVDLVA